MGGILQVMASVQLPDMSRLAAATAHLEPPFAVVDEVALAHNTADLVRRAAGKPLRLATKSVRVRGLVERSAATDGFAGVMTYSLAESVWLADHGVDDILLAYRTAVDVVHVVHADGTTTALPTYRGEAHNFG